MIKNTNEIEIFQKNHVIAIIALIQYVLLLVLRDIYVISINKYLFIALSLVSFILLDIEYTIYLFVFLIPLYVGLPGNYITILFLIKILLSPQYFRVKFTSVLFAILGVIVIYCGIFLNGGLTVVKALFGPSVLIIVLLLSTKDTLKHRELCAFYSVGVAVLGAIMLISTLKVNSFSDLLSPHFRLGTKSVELATTELMKTVIDPNYYGFFSISALVCSFRYLVLKDKEESGGIWIIVSNSICLLVALIGLSRTYVISLILFAIVVMVARKNRVNLMIVFAFLLLAVAAFVFFKEPLISIIRILGDRFNDDTVAGGNGRVESIMYYYSVWSTNLRVLLIGTGIFNCTVHCMPLQFLFGGGLLSFVFFICLAVTLCEQFAQECSISGGTRWWPELIVFIYSLTVPVATMLNVFFPIVFVAMTTRTFYYKTDGIRINSACRYFK